MIGDILSSLFLPHVIALALLFRIAMWEQRPNGTFRDDMRRLWVWVRPQWMMMVSHPLYWAIAGIVTAFLLIEPIRRIFL